jgi:hypothetical protein
MTDCPYCLRTDAHRHSVTLGNGRMIVDGHEIPTQGPVRVKPLSRPTPKKPGRRAKP